MIRLHAVRSVQLLLLSSLQAISLCQSLYPFVYHSVHRLFLSWLELKVNVSPDAVVCRWQFFGGTAT